MIYTSKCDCINIITSHFVHNYCKNIRTACMGFVYKLVNQGVAGSISYVIKTIFSPVLVDVSAADIVKVFAQSINAYV
jgi:hypothetical protein